MASAQLAAEEELQQSVVVSEEDLERDDSDSSNAAMLPYQNQDDTSEPSRTGVGNQSSLHVNGLEDLIIERHGGPTATLVSKNAESIEDDAEGEEDAPGEDDGAADAEEIVNPYDENDAEGEEDVEHVVQLNMDQDEGVGEAAEQSTGSVQSGDDEDDNDDEGSAKKKGTGAAAYEAAGGEAARVQFEDLVALHGDARVSGAAAPGGDIAYTNIASDIPAVGDE
ncbi:hypothetical protein BN1723_003115 [Verticillium longisporum]|uniref:Uncharacterized protein n=1 Tax=Verticillium longisporum TaxID=100787 RepID=A0A0G4LPV2_VERLO|nr:hypothetical protein BN1723_003115 [Verticillium longisporum]